MKVDPEYYLIASVMWSDYALHQALSKLSTQDFETPDCLEIFQVCKSLHDRKIDVDTLKITLELEKTGRLTNAGGRERISELVKLRSSSIDVDYCIGEIKERSRKKNFLTLADHAIHKAQNEDNLDSVIEEHIKKISELQAGTEEDFISFSEVGANFQDGMSFGEHLKHQSDLISQGIDPYDGFRTGYQQLDSIIGGFEKGTTTIVGARSSTGKTTFFINLFINFFKKYPQKRIGFFSLEMPKKRIYEKCVVTFAGVPLSKIKCFFEKDEKFSQSAPLTDEEYQRIAESAKMLEPINLYLNDFSGISINQLKAMTRKAVIKQKFDIIFIDYLSRIQGDKKYNNKHMEMDQVSKGLQDIALEMNIPVVTLAQLNRNIYGRPEKQPVLSDLRESGSIEEDADTVLLLHRPKTFNPQLPNDYTEIIVAKNRLLGDLGKVTFSYQDGILTELSSIEKLMPHQVNNALTEEDHRGMKTSW